MRDDIGMPDITVDKEDLIVTLRTNRASHAAAYAEAAVAFRVKALKRLQEMQAEVQREKIPRSIYFELPVPEQHTEDYDRALAMLERHVGDTVALSEEAYRRLVDDEWGWRQRWTDSTLAYTARAGQ